MRPCPSRAYALRAQVNATNVDGCTALLQAARLGHTASVRALLRADESEDSAAAERTAAIAVAAAAAAQRARAAEKLSGGTRDVAVEKRAATLELVVVEKAAEQASSELKVEVRVQIRSAAGDPSQQVELVEAAHEPQPLDVNAADMHGYTALMYAARSGDCAMAAALLAHENIDVNATGDAKGWTALMTSAFHGQATVGAHALHIIIHRAPMLSLSTPIHALIALTELACMYAIRTGRRRAARL